MGLLSKTVDVVLNSRNIKHFEELGYYIPRIKDRHRNFGVPRGTKITVNVVDLLGNSPTRISCQCDECGKKYEIEYREYLKYKRNEDTIYCRLCAYTLYAIKKIKQSRFDRSISLDKKFPQSLLVWSDENIFLPKDYTWGCHDEVKWKCENNKHNDYQRSILAEGKCKFRCPNCIRENKASILQLKVSDYLESKNIVVKHEKDCVLFCINPLTNSRLFYDNEIILNNFKLIIEIHGKQHYEISGWHYTVAKSEGKTPEDALEYQQKKDEYKKQFALNNGYYYLSIPYTADDKKETWKTMIDNVLLNAL